MSSVELVAEPESDSIKRTSTYSSTIIAIVLLACASVTARLPGIYSRAIWHDEAISLLQSAGHPRPRWPDGVRTAGELQGMFLRGDPGFSEIAENLARTDIHPPLYWWCLSPWRKWFGESVESIRWFSLTCSVMGVLVFYCLLLALRWPVPLLAAAIYSLSTSSVHFGHEARPYALALLLLLGAALAAALIDRVQRKDMTLVLALSSGALSGLAFLTNYLTIFPTAIILVWCVLIGLRRGRWIPFACFLPAILLAATVFPTAAAQSRTRPSYLAEPASPLAECQTAMMNTLDVLCDPAILSPTLSRLMHGLLFFLLIVGILYLWECPSEESFRAYSLLIPLVCSGAIGVVVLDVFLHKHLNVIRYFAFSGPPLAAIVSVGVFSLVRRAKWVGITIAALLILMQLSCVNWGEETCPHRHDGDPLRSLAKQLATAPDPFVVAMVTIDEGYTSALIYELDPGVKVAFVAKDQDIDRFVSELDAFSHAWLIPFDDGWAHRQYLLLEALVHRREVESDFYVSERLGDVILLSRSDGPDVED